MEKELWLPIPNYEGYYKISNTGKIRSLTRTIIDINGREFTLKGKEKTPHISTDGYYIIGLNKDGIKKNLKVHRLVALTFIPNPNNLPFVNHKDENKLNNNVNNLEWCTQEYNNNYGTRVERISQTMSKNSVIMCDKNTHEPIKEFLNANMASKEMGDSSSSHIYQVLNGERKSAYGYWWKYKDNA